ncbi:1-acyl-sn-glycerol-3-phosphate acyltransferase [Brucepastera parasyntrophica]|uniref:1-acyl-sn-glycerol-3-phosphate acyltransferase n=1 Tax=Brucepastera parasyntrophica TaxID=2880008 RepID=UPI00210DA304|nr:1-acyl-sn-glycerol-3-phosphate acyltransferase [Brucepastera parasyntrophica]ULQ59002.1 1-acyl-sn-glycerol-3-phosphate acyltransferase [Brucepastera parasyntrophica]
MIRLVGGIPIPSGFHAMNKFNEAFDELHRKRKWFHVFPEGCNWPYFQPIRPFKRGAFTFSQRYNMPIIPMAFTYRKPTGLFALYKGKYPLITLNIGEPIFPDITLPRKESIMRLREQTHKKIVELAGIKNNPFPSEGD